MEKILGVIFALIFCALFAHYDSIPIDKRVWGGEQVTWKHHPYFVTFRIKNVESPYDIVCGGTIVSYNFVLTAAHEMYFWRDRDRIANLMIMYGQDLPIPRPKQGGITDILELRFHPKFNFSERWNSRFFKWDIVVAKTATMLTPKLKLSYIYIRDTPPVPPEFVRIVGMGSFSESEKYPNTSRQLRAATMHIVSTKQCWRTYMNYDQIPDFAEYLLCAQSPKNGHGSCDRDIGGPAVSYPNFLAGVITDRKVKCSHPDQVEFYVNLAHPDYVYDLRNMTDCEARIEHYEPPGYLLPGDYVGETYQDYRLDILHHPDPD